MKAIASTHILHLLVSRY